MKKSSIERAIDKVDAEIAVLEAVKARLIAAAAREPVKRRRAKGEGNIGSINRSVERKASGE